MNCNERSVILREKGCLPYFSIYELVKFKSRDRRNEKYQRVYNTFKSCFHTEKRHSSVSLSTVRNAFVRKIVHMYSTLKEFDDTSIFCMYHAILIRKKSMSMFQVFSHYKWNRRIINSIDSKTSLNF